MDRVIQTECKFEFQFIMLTRYQTRVSQVIRTKLNKFITFGIGFYPAEILIYSASIFGIVEEFISQKYEASNRPHSAKKEEIKEKNHNAEQR